MNDYQIRFSPQLEIKPADFVAAWNDTQVCRAVAEAKINTSAKTYDVASAITLLSGIARGVATNMIYDLIKQAVINQVAVQHLLKKRGLPKHTDSISVQTVEQSDGSQMLIVVIKGR
jgi:Asp-tRNA(Asn)/Glu-tRNA(Gln) amidotransferase B subunit